MVARVLYRDALMLVIDKPPGFAVHQGPKGARGGESLEDHFDALRFGLPRAPALAHRLDRDTSGCLELGRHRKALAELGRLFKGGRIGKTYWAVVEGGPAEDEGRIDAPLGRKDATRGWWMKPDPQGQPAVTVWKVLGRSLTPTDDKELGAQLTWLALEPLTGRTHQLRVHCATQCPAYGWSWPASARATDRGTALQESRTHLGERAGAAAPERAAAGVRMAGRGLPAGVENC